MKHGIYQITVCGQSYWEVYIRGQFFEMFSVKGKAETKFNSLQGGNQ